MRANEIKVADLLKQIYENNYKKGDEEKIIAIAEKYKTEKTFPRLNEKDNFLIIYPDAIREKGNSTLKTLKSFLGENADFIKNIHLLPMFDYTSDDGYAVKDYLKIRENCGTWEDVENLGKSYGVIMDLVINHVSSQSEWLKNYLNGEEEYKDFFIEYDDQFDFSHVVRPRTSPLFHTYEGKIGKKKLWTTFGEDQVDLNYANYQVLLKMLEVIGEYFHHGARCIRLDAVCYLWKESGSKCCNLKKTHIVIQLIRLFMNMVCPGALLLTQTNVEAEENKKYFGDGKNEANMIYQFVLPPLVMYTILNENAEKLSEWAGTIKKISNETTFFNFLGGHDGVGLRPVKGILTSDEIIAMAENVQAHGGKISCSSTAEGEKEIYELNTNYLSGLSKITDSDEICRKKTLAAHAVLISLMGVPAIYYHALFGSRNDLKGMEESKMPRRINRQKFERDHLEKLLQEEKIRREIWEGIRELLEVRAHCGAFDPYNPQRILKTDKQIFGIERWSENQEKKCREKVFVNVSSSQKEVKLGRDIYREEITGEELTGTITLEPYSYIFLRKL